MVSSNQTIWALSQPRTNLDLYKALATYVLPPLPHATRHPKRMPPSIIEDMEGVISEERWNIVRLGKVGKIILNYKIYVIRCPKSKLSFLCGLGPLLIVRHSM